MRRPPQSTPAKRQFNRPCALRRCSSATACRNEQGSTVQAPIVNHDVSPFGLPEAFFVDNGDQPLGKSVRHSTGPVRARGFSSSGIAVLHSRPYHPQSRGKNERFHRTARNCRRFDPWRSRRCPRSRRGCSAPSRTGALSTILDRPHRARTRLRRCRPAAIGRSPRSMPDRLPQLEYHEPLEIGAHGSPHQGLHRVQSSAPDRAASVPWRAHRHPAAHNSTPSVHGRYLFGAYQIATPLAA